MKTTNEAFALWLSRGRPGFIAREGASPQTVFEQIHASGGVASLAHPGLLRRDEWIAGLVASGLDAIEAYHPSHDEMQRIARLAASRGREPARRRFRSAPRARRDPGHGVERRDFLIKQQVETVEPLSQLTRFGGNAVLSRFGLPRSLPL